MWRLRRYLMLLLAALLVAGAVFLPGQISQWGDQQLLDEPHITQEAEREGFAEAVQLTVAEKLLLMHSGALDSLSLSEEGPAGLYAENVLLSPGGTEVEFYAGKQPDAYQEQNEAAEVLSQAAAQKWSARLAEVQTEVRTLQAMGGLPSLWSADSELEFTGYGQMLYIDRATQLSFQVYSLDLRCAPYSLDLTVDQQSGRILSFSLSWERSEELVWGLRGASGFGTAWRDYWGLDSVGGSWYNEYNRSILEDTVKTLRRDGDYNSNSQIPFTYNGRPLNIPLLNWATGSRGYTLLWNRT